MTEAGETSAGADAAPEGNSQPAGREPDWTPFCTRWEDKGQGGIQKGGKRQPKADHKEPECSPPSAANFGSWLGRRTRRRTAGRTNGTVEARVS
jgi:hypothetical protein